MIMYVFDARWPGRMQPSPTHRQGTVLASFVVPARETIPAIVDKIRTLSQGEKSIWLLRLCAHGNAGYLQLGEGLTQRNARYLSPLAKYFTPGGRGIELHACGTASILTLGADGRGYGVASPPFLQALANATGVPVGGCENVNEAEDEFRLDWPAQRVFPDKHPRLDQDLPGMSHGL